MLMTLDLNDARQISELGALEKAASPHETALGLAPGETVIGWRIDDDLLGALGYTADGQQLDILRLVVAPSASRKGIATRLLGELFLRAGSRLIRVATDSANAPAIVLYTDLGFVVEREIRLPGGQRQIHLQRNAYRQP